MELPKLYFNRRPGSILKCQTTLITIENNDDGFVHHLSNRGHCFWNGACQYDYVDSGTTSPPSGEGEVPSSLRAKPKGSICLVLMLADAAFWLCRAAAYFSSKQTLPFGFAEQCYGRPNRQSSIIHYNRRNERLRCRCEYLQMQVFLPLSSHLNWPAMLQDWQ